MRYSGDKSRPVSPVFDHRSVGLKVFHPVLLLSSVQVKPFLLVVLFSCHNISLSIHVPHRFQDEFSLGEARNQEKLPVLAFSVNVDFLDG